MNRTEQLGFLSATTDCRDIVGKHILAESNEHTKETLKTIMDEMLQNYDEKIK